MLGKGEDSREDSIVNEEKRNNVALEKYRSEGYGQNANGEFFNPWTDEYDSDYDPRQDKAYNPPEIENSNNMTGSNNRLKEQKEISLPRRALRATGRETKRVLRASAAAGKVAGKKFLGKIPQLPKHVASAAVGLTAGTAAASIGIAAAAAAGDPGKVGTALATGAGTAYLIGRATNNSSLDPDVKEAYDRMYNSPEYKEEIMEKQIKELKKNETIRQKMKAADIDVKEMMKKGGNFEQFTKNGIDDIDDIIAAQKLIDNHTFNNVDHATAVIQNDKRMGRKDPNKMSKKTRNEWEDTFKEEYMKAGASETKAIDTVGKTMNLVHELHKAKK